MSATRRHSRRGDERVGVRLILTADDFGLSLGVNEAVEQAHHDGVLTHASLMVAGPAAADAIARAKRMPGLDVGLHLVAVEGPAVLPAADIPDLVDRQGWFPSHQFRLGLQYAFSPKVRSQLAREVAAQFDAFAATGLALSHADAHKHMHLHPYVASLLLRHGARHGLRRVRVPQEPDLAGERSTIGARALRTWAGSLRRRVQAAGMVAPPAVFGLTWSGHLTEARVLRLLDVAPPGAELYFHPGTHRDALLRRLMPDYEHEAELAALLSPAVRAALQSGSAVALARRSM